MDWYGPDGVYIELHQNLLPGDTKRNRQIFNLARDCGMPVIATNEALYHIPDRYKLQHALVAAAHNTTIDRALPRIKPNDQFSLKSAERMRRLFRHRPEAVDNTLRIVESCDFNLDADLGYRLPDADVPDGFTPQTYLERLCYEAAVWRYGMVAEEVDKRLREEFRLIELHGMAGFLLLYRMCAEGCVDLSLAAQSRQDASGDVLLFLAPRYQDSLDGLRGSSIFPLRRLVR